MEEMVYVCNVRYDDDDDEDDATVQNNDTSGAGPVLHLPVMNFGEDRANCCPQCGTLISSPWGQANVAANEPASNYCPVCGASLISAAPQFPAPPEAVGNQRGIHNYGGAATVPPGMASPAGNWESSGPALSRPVMHFDPPGNVGNRPAEPTRQPTHNRQANAGTSSAGPALSLPKMEF